MKTKNSILTDRLNSIFTTSSKEEATKLFIEAVDQSRIPQETKRRMKLQVENCNSLLDVQRYASNSAMKFEGMGV